MAIRQTRRRDFLLQLADLVLDNKYSSFAEWNHQRKILTLKNKDVFIINIIPHKFGLKGLQSFIHQMGLYKFNKITSRKRGISSTLLFKCGNAKNFQKFLMLVDLSRQAQHSVAISLTKLDKIKGIVKQNTPIQQVLQFIFQLKKINRRIHDLQINAIIKMGIQTQNQSKEAEDRLLDVSEKDVFSPLKIKTLDIIPSYSDI